MSSYFADCGSITVSQHFLIQPEDHAVTDLRGKL